MSEQILFQTRADFTQAAFDRVADIVSQYGSQILECFCPAISTQNCLEHLSVVAESYSYDISKIDIHLHNFEKSNSELYDLGFD